MRTPCGQLQEGRLVLIALLVLAPTNAPHALAQGDATGKTVAIHGMHMYYEIHGDRGDPLILLHGFFQSGRQLWTPLVPELAKQYRVIVPDLRGHGRTTNPSAEFTFGQSAEDVIALLDHLGIKSCKAIGHTAGAMTLLHIATQRPERVQAMVLHAASYYFPNTAREKIGQAIEGVRESNSFYEEMRKVHVRGDVQILQLIEQMDGFTEKDDMNFTPASLSTIKSRMLIVHGDRDEFFPVEIAVEMYRAVPRASLWVIPNGKHALSEREHAPFVSVALDFLSGDLKSDEP